MNKCINCNKEYNKVTHRVTCPKCKKIYDGSILHEKCKTKGCNVWFFHNESNQIITRWIDLASSFAELTKPLRKAKKKISEKEVNQHIHKMEKR